jgi:hypothetical protein
LKLIVLFIGNILSLVLIKMLQYPTEIQSNMTLPTLGTLQPQQFEMGGVLPRTYLRNVNIERQGVAGQAQALGFDTPMFQSTAEEYLSSAREKDMSELQQQRMAGVPKNSYFSFADTSSGPTNFNWSTRPMANLERSTNTIPFKYAETWPLGDKQSRSEARTTMGDQIIKKNTALRSVRLY